MAAAELGSGEHLRMCRHCGVAIIVNGQEIVRTLPTEPAIPPEEQGHQQERLPV